MKLFVLKTINLATLVYQLFLIQTNANTTQKYLQLPNYADYLTVMACFHDNETTILCVFCLCVSTCIDMGINIDPGVCLCLCVWACMSVCVWACMSVPVCETLISTPLLQYCPSTVQHFFCTLQNAYAVEQELYMLH